MYVVHCYKRKKERMLSQKERKNALIKRKNEKGRKKEVKKKKERKKERMFSLNPVTPFSLGSEK